MVVYVGNNSNNTPTASTGDDSLYGGGGNDTLNGLAGNDLLDGGTGNDSLNGGDGNDSLDGGANNDRIYGGDGSDLFTLTGSFGRDSIYGGSALDTAGDLIDAGALTSGVTLNFTGVEAGSIYLTTSTANTAAFTEVERFLLTGFADTVTAAGAGAGVTVDAGAGNDTLTGSDFGDTLSGGLGHDTLSSGAGNDTVYDEFSGNTAAGGADTVNLGAGDDTYIGSGSGAGDTDLILGAEGNDTITTAGGIDTVYGGDGQDVITAGDDTLASAGDQLHGDLGDDTLNGGTANDTLYGGGGADQVLGNGGADLIYGGSNSGIGVTFITNGSFTSGATGWTGTDIEATNSEDAYLHNGSGNTVAEVDGNAGATTVMQQSFSVAGNQSADVTFRSALRTEAAAQAGIDGFRVDILDASGTVVGTMNVYPTSTTAWTNYSFAVTFPTAGVYTLRLTELGNNDSLGAVIDDVQVTSTTTALDTSADTLSGGSGNDTIHGEGGNDLLLFGTGDNQVYGGLGDDVLDDVDGGYETGNNLLDAGSGNDTIWFGAGNTTVYGGDGDDRIDDTGALELAGFNLIDAGAGHDAVAAGLDDDTVYGGSGNDTLQGQSGNDSLFGGEDADALDGGADQDSLYGGDGDDNLTGGSGNDSLFGGLGTNTVYGGEGDDTFGLEPGSDSISGGSALFGGTGNDAFRGAFGDTVDGGENVGDADVLDLTDWGWSLTNIVYGANPESGTVYFLNSAGGVIGEMAFSNIEQVITCFTPGTLIRTDRGPVAVDRLAVGDLVETRDRGLQPLRWIGRRDLTLADLIVRPQLQPVRIAQGALGAGLPCRDMLVSPQHRMLIEGPRAEMLFGEAEVLVAATHLTALAGVSQVRSLGISYIHLMFDAHELIEADGAWSESFQPAARSLAPDQLAEMAALFPDMVQDFDQFTAARLSLKAYEARALLAA